MMDLLYWLLLHVYAVSPLSLTLKSCETNTDIKFINCSSRGFTTVVDNVPPDREHVDLSRNSLTALGVGDFRLLWNLRVLLLNDNNITAVADGTFSPLESLQRLDLSRNRLSSLREGFSLGLTSLKELQLAENQLTSLDSGSFQHLDSLQRLNLSGNAISSIQARAFGCMTALRQLSLENNRLRSLSNGVFSVLRSLEVLNLQGNSISSTEAQVFTPLTSLALLNLARNHLSTIRFKTFLSLRAHSTHIQLAANPWHCDCDLQRVFRKLQSVQRLFLDDYVNLSCREPPELQGYRLTDVNAELCIAETVTVLIITITLVITVVAAIVMAEKNKKKDTGKIWTKEDSALEAYSED